MSSKSCYHCGDTIRSVKVDFDEKLFCCNGCKTVYELINSSDLSNFYDLENNAGIKPKTIQKHQYEFLDIEELREIYVDFEDENTIRVTIQIPDIHCSSCIYLLENIGRIKKGITSSQVNFGKKTASFIIQKDIIKLSELAILLDQIGYKPNFEKHLNKKSNSNKTILYKIGVAGFAFGNIMLWTFPEYLGIDIGNQRFRNFTSYLSFVIGLPVLLYSSRDYFISAYKSLKHKTINLDVPIALGIITLFIKSSAEIFLKNGPGYMDSFAGFIFFLLIGKWFQNRTYQSLSFDRDNSNYFPVAILKVINQKESLVDINKIEVNDTIIVRNEEIIPCDSILESEKATLDYSFVTGESNSITKVKGDKIFAGGKLLGSRKEFKVLALSSQSYLNELWNQSNKKKENKSNSDKLSIYFLIGILLVASISALVWFFIDSSRVTEIVVSILIVACPCALALSKPFTYGNILRELGKKGFYLKNSHVIEELNEIDTIVFDKTGTLTSDSFSSIKFSGNTLSDEQFSAIKTICESSTHPLSQSIAKEIRQNSLDVTLDDYREIAGKGIHVKINEIPYKIGSALFMNQLPGNEIEVHIEINSEYQGRFTFSSSFRKELSNVFENLKQNYQLHILSGDSSKDEVKLKSLIPEINSIHFNQSPGDKFSFIKKLQNEGKKVIMIGDGLNDGAALQQSNVGIAISENVFHFSPSSQAIFDANSFSQLPKILSFSKRSKTILQICIIFSILYNLTGLIFALTGTLSPIVAAILMPISSITIVLLSIFLVKLFD